MTARPASPGAGLVQQVEIPEPLDVRLAATVQGGFDRTINAGMALQVMDHGGAQRKGNDDEKEVQPVPACKAQEGAQPRTRQPPREARIIIFFQQRPDKGQHRTDDRQLSGPVRKNPRPSVRDVLEQMALADGKHPGRRIKKQISQLPVDRGQVEGDEDQ